MVKQVRLNFFSKGGVPLPQNAKSNPMTSMMKSLCRIPLGGLALTLGLSVFSFSTELHAAEPEAAPPTGTGGQQAPASAGATEIEGQGNFATSSGPAPEEETTDALELTLSAGGLLSTGNARAAAVTGAADFRYRKNIHQVAAKLAGNYGAAAIDDEKDLEQTVGNIQGRVRYDVFFAKRWSAFLMVTGRHDRFQGLDMRMNIDPGVAFYALTSAKQRLWFEASYDLQHDIRTDEAIEEARLGDPPVSLGKTKTIHAGRLFAGYSNQLHSALTLDTGVEYLQSFLESETFRINWDTAITAQLVNKFSLAFTFTLRYENNPLPEVKNLDTITSVNLVYRF